MKNPQTSDSKIYESTGQSAMRPFKKIFAASKASDIHCVASPAPVQNTLTRTGVKSYICDLCNHSFSQTSELKRHKDIVHKRVCTHSCKVCDKRFENPAILTRHMFTHTGVRSNRSDFRDKTFSQMYSTNIHKQSYHQNNTCKVCGSRFDKSFELRRHSNAHTTSETIHTCDVCSKCFISSSQFKSHSFTHTYEYE